MAVPTTHSAPSKPLRIFVVENHRDTLQMMKMYLEMLGHTVQTATSMSKALAAFPQAEHDVLISDIGLPDGDGWQLLRSLPRPHPIYAIAMSGFGMSADHLKSQEAGYHRHLLKPVDATQLDAALEEAAREIAARLEKEREP